MEGKKKGYGEVGIDRAYIRVLYKGSNCPSMLDKRPEKQTGRGKVPMEAKGFGQMIKQS